MAGICYKKGPILSLWAYKDIIEQIKIGLTKLAGVVLAATQEGLSFILFVGIKLILQKVRDERYTQNKEDKLPKKAVKLQRKMERERERESESES